MNSEFMHTYNIVIIIMAIANLIKNKHLIKVRREV